MKRFFYYIKNFCILFLLIYPISCETPPINKNSTIISPKIEQENDNNMLVSNGKHTNQKSVLNEKSKIKNKKKLHDKGSSHKNDESKIVENKSKVVNINQQNKYQSQIKAQNYELPHISSNKNKLFRGVSVVSINSKNKWEEIHFYDKTYAVIIGIDKYKSLPSDQHLSYAISDAKAVERLLRNKFLFNKIFTLYNEQATKNNILGLLLNKLSKVSKNDAVFVFFAGHGGQEKTDFGDIGFIIPYDGNFEDMRTVISMTAIRDDISKRIKAKHVFYVMDSCYSGILVSKRSATSVKTRRSIDYLKQIAREPVRQVLTAGSANQKVMDGGPEGHSVFTGRLLEIFNDANDYITANEISSIIKEKVFSDAKARGHIQTPKSGELFGLGDFIFMPSITKKIGNIKDQIAGLENELIKIKNAETIAIEHQNRVAQRKAERMRKIAESKLIAKKLEEKRLNEEKLLREKRKQEHINLMSKQQKQKEEEEERLAKLQHEVELKRKQYKKSMITSLDDALREMQTLDKEIKDIRLKFINDLKKRILSIAQLYSDNYSSSSLVKDEFETEAEYQDRIRKHTNGIQNTNKSEFEKAIYLIQTSYENQIQSLKNQIIEVSHSAYTVYGHDALIIKLGKYDADKQSFKVTVASKNIKRPVYPQGRVVFVSSSSGQARRVGIQKGDIVLKYNNINVLPGVNWDRLKQTVVSDKVVIEIDRKGTLLYFSLNKGKIGIDTYVGEYLNLDPNQYAIHGDIFVPRPDARRFKQNYINNFISAELKVLPASPFMSLVTQAKIIDESNDKIYDLFKSDYLCLGNRIVYDNTNHIYWLTLVHKQKLSWYGANNLLGKLNYKGLKGWRLPTISEFQNLQYKKFKYFFNFPNGEFHTNTEHGVHDSQINFWKKKIYKENKNERELFTFSLPKDYHLDRYVFFPVRFFKLNSLIVFDTQQKIIWSNYNIDNKYTWLEANRYLQSFTYSGLKGWRLPTAKEFSSLYDNTILGPNKIFNFNYSEYHTKDRQGGHDIQYNPKKNKTYKESINEREGVMCVM